MSVNDISGLPILEVFSDDRVVMGTFNRNTLVVTGSRIGIDKAVPTADLDISGSVFITGSLRMNSGGITGSLFGTSSVATSASFAVSASWAPPASSGVTSITVSDGLSGGVITTTGTISLNTGSVHFLDGVKKELNTEGVISSSLQINTGSFSGSLTGTVFGTASFATSASFAPTILPSGIVSSSTQISHNSTTGYVANEHINHTTVSISAGSGLSGGGDISATRTITLDTGSVHFLDGVKKELNTEGVVSSSLQINTGSFSGSFTGVLGNKYTTLFGNGTATTFTITHNLNNTSVLAQIVREASGSFVYPDITISGSNDITLEFSTAPATNEYRANVYGF
jgi:hypothetical protein